MSLQGTTKLMIKSLANKFGIAPVRLEYLKTLLKKNGELAEILKIKEQDHTSHRNKLAHLSEKGLAFHYHPIHGPSFQLNEGKNQNKVLICSIPKCGTYFAAEILKTFGFIDTNVQLWQDFLHDYRGQTVENKRADILPKQIDICLRESLELICPGQFSVGHFPYTPENKKLFENFKVVYVYRNLRNSCVSMMRFADELKPESHWFLKGEWQQHQDKKTKFLEFLKTHGEMYFNWIKPITEWFGRAYLLNVSYEDLCGANGKPIQNRTYLKLGDFLDLEANTSPDGSIAATAANTKTMTSTGQPSNYENYWSDETESLFKKQGFYELNQSLGYE